MNKKEAQEAAKRVVEYLFFDNEDNKPVNKTTARHRKPVVRLMLVYGGEDFKNPGWGRESVRGAIVDEIMKSSKIATPQE